MKIVIVGPGAMGCLFAAFLSRSKAEVWVLDRNKERAKIIEEQGITVEGASGSWQAKLRAGSQGSEIGKADVIIICVKSYDTKEAIESAKALIDENSIVITLQNGIGNIEVLSEVVGAERVIGGVTNQGSTLLGPARIRHAGKGETVLGRIDGKLPVELREVREVFNKCGLQTRISRDIKGLLWSKLIINVGINALTCITGLNNGRLVEFEATRQILRDAVTEAVKVVKKKRIKLIYDDPLAKVEAVCEATSANVSSMLADVMSKRRTEIDFINGVIVRQGMSMGIPTPVNWVLTNLVKTIEGTYKTRVS
ncbi:MAG: 2-dehydropantoate 2-reductase, partial [Candidatus Omnitrophica bacterium]|nr:2-dehydropantoate 2-reductase [Candidatus Omnitrophota bacterium]MDD5654486.1 2-dehydropantoate 2-reductase [Candidatus Omnitrophota bacterium]